LLIATGFWSLVTGALSPVAGLTWGKAKPAQDFIFNTDAELKNAWGE